MVSSGLLYSQIGYDCHDPKRALIRSTAASFPGEGITINLKKTGSSLICHRGKVSYWGEKWNSFWWVLDFSDLDEPGEYELIVKRKKENLFEGQILSIGDSLLWNKTIDSVALDQFEKRADLAPHGKTGWKDCGANMKEANSHATTVIGMCDLLGLGFENYLTEDQQSRLVRQIINGCDYLALCQDKAEDIGFDKGSIIHEIPNNMILIPGDTAQSVVAFAYASRLLTARNYDKSREYLARAVSAYNYLIEHGHPYGANGFSRSNHGAPDNYSVPDEFMTRDLFMMLWGGYELCLTGQLKYKEKVVELARTIHGRQISKEEGEGEFYGHFRTFDRSSFSEKANVHHHVGHDTGGTFPFYLVPLVDMARNWYDHEDNSLWRSMIEDFVYGFFIPACKENPFFLIPEGYFTNEGILNFCGPWHGINTTIAFGASLAAKLEGFLGEPVLRDIAIGNLQWIAGLNSGVTRDSFKSCVKWKGHVDEGVFEPVSQIVGIGRKTVECWTGIRGTIPNGFSANPQFRLTVEPLRKNDGPFLYTDEDWIPHSAGWISALQYPKP
jgi:hypothetical protein